MLIYIVRIVDHDSLNFLFILVSISLNSLFILVSITLIDKTF